MNHQEPTAVDTLYLDAEHFVLTVESQPPLKTRMIVMPIGGRFPGITPSSEEAT